MSPFLNLDCFLAFMLIQKSEHSLSLEILVKENMHVRTNA